jgi:hypothetical protein
MKNLAVFLTALLLFVASNAEADDRVLRAKAAAAAVMASLDAPLAPAVETKAAGSNEVCFVSLAEARVSGKPVAVYVSGRNCGPCRYVEANVLTSPEVVTAAKAFAFVHLNDADPLSVDGATVTAAEALGVSSVPAVVFLTPRYTLAGRTIAKRNAAAFAAELTAWHAKIIEGEGEGGAAGR